MNIHKSQSSRAIYTSVQRVARSRADAAAVVFGSRIVTYGELLELADRLAARLATAFGDETHRLVAILGSAQPEFIACILAVLRNGWTYLPLVTSHPRIRNDAIIEDAGADAMMILGPNGEVELAGTRSHTLDPEDQEKLKDRVYVMYTSGSTGSPKGSAASVAAVLNVIDFMRRQFAFNRVEQPAWGNQFRLGPFSTGYLSPDQHRRSTRACYIRRTWRACGDSVLHRPLRYRSDAGLAINVEVDRRFRLDGSGGAHGGYRRRGTPASARPRAHPALPRAVELLRPGRVYGLVNVWTGAGPGTNQPGLCIARSSASTCCARTTSSQPRARRVKSLFPVSGSPTAIFIARR